MKKAALHVFLVLTAGTHLSAQIECPPQSLYWSANFAQLQPFAMTVTSMWTPGLEIPGVCLDGECSFHAWFEIEIWTDPAVSGVPVRACVSQGFQQACGTFPIPHDPALPAFTQSLTGPFHWVLKCGSALDLELEYYDPWGQVWLSLAKVSFACGGC